MTFPFQTEADMHDAWNTMILNGANTKAAAAIAAHRRHQVFREQGSERGAEPPTPRDHEAEPYSTIWNSHAILDPDSGVYDAASSSADSVATVHTLVTKLIEEDAIVTDDDRQAMLEVLKIPIGDFATIYPAEYNRLVSSGIMTARINPGAGMRWQEQGVPTDEVFVEPEQPLFETFNKNVMPPAMLATIEGTAALGAPVMSYQAWRIKNSKPKDTRQSKAEYQFYLLEQTHNANSNSNVDNPDDLMYFSWDPEKPEAAPTLLKGQEAIAEVDETAASAMEDMINQEQFVTPTVGQTGQFASATFSKSELGQQMTAEMGKAFEVAGISVPAESLVWTMSYGTLQAIPNLALAEGQQLFEGVDLNQLSNDELITMMKRLDREQGLPDPLKNLLTQFEAVPSDTRRSVIGVALQEHATLNPIAHETMTRDANEFMEPADYTFDVDVAEGWTDPGGWRPPDGTGATYQTVRAGARRESFEWDYAPGQVPEGRMMEPEIPGYQMTIPYETGTSIKQIITDVGGNASLWGSPEIMAHIFQAAANRDIPQQIALAFLHQKTNGFTETMDPQTAMNVITQDLDQLSGSMLRYGNPALAVIDQLFPDVARTLQSVGWLDKNHASVVSGAYDQFMELAHAFPGQFDDMYFQMAGNALSVNAGTDPSMTRVDHEDPLKVKDALRDTFEALLMPVDDKVLDSFAAQFAAAENAAYQPLTNAYNQIVSQNREIFTSLNTAVTPNVGAYSWLFPVAGSNSYGNSFGDDRSGHSHGGIDIMASNGTPVVAPVSGKVTSVGTAGPNGTGNAGGNRIHLLGDDGILYYFAHNSYNAVSAGDHVTAGQTIGLVGNTGNAWKGGTGAPHLHFEMHANGQFNSQSYNPGGDGRVNPYNYLQAAENEGATVISPWDTVDWQGQSIEDAARAAAAGMGGTVEITLPDLVARARQSARDTPLYEDLFGEKPVGISDVDYASAFAGTAATLAGAPAPEAARVGAATGSMDALYGQLLSDTDMADTSTTFRGRLFEQSNAFIEAMGGRPS